MSKHELLLMHTSASVETQDPLEAVIPVTNCMHRSLASITSGASVPSEKSVVACISNIPTNFWTLPSKRDQSSSFPSMAAYCCVDPQKQVPEGEMSQLIVTLTTPSDGSFSVAVSQLIVEYGINTSPKLIWVPCCEEDLNAVPTASEGGRFDMPSTLALAGNRLTSLLVCGTAIEGSTIAAIIETSPKVANA